jgi:hypothetical protein
MRSLIIVAMVGQSTFTAGAAAGIVGTFGLVALNKGGKCRMCGRADAQAAPSPEIA